MTTYFAVHNDCIFKNPSLFCGKKCLQPVSVTVTCAQPRPELRAAHPRSGFLLGWCWSCSGTLCLWDPGGSASLERMYGELFAKGILNKGQLALYDSLTWVLIVCRCCWGSDFLQE